MGELRKSKLGRGSWALTSMPKSVRGSKRADLKVRDWRVSDSTVEEACTYRSKRERESVCV